MLFILGTELLVVRTLQKAGPPFDVVRRSGLEVASLARRGC
jgi:hypothetical protein